MLVIGMLIVANVFLLFFNWFLWGLLTGLALVIYLIERLRMAKKSIGKSIDTPSRA